MCVFIEFKKDILSWLSSDQEIGTTRFESLLRILLPWALSQILFCRKTGRNPEKIDTKGNISRDTASPSTEEETGSEDDPDGGIGLTSTVEETGSEDDPDGGIGLTSTEEETCSEDNLDGGIGFTSSGKDTGSEDNSDGATTFA